MKKLLVLFGFLFLVGCGPNQTPTPDPTPSSPPPQQKVLQMPYYPQLTQQWCWAATEQMLLSYFGYQYTQESIVIYAYGAPIIQAAPTPLMQQELYNLGVSTNLYGALSFDAIKSLITAGKPIIIAYNGSFSGHVVVLYGYDVNNVYINDPYFGQFVVPYATAFYYGNGPSTMTWYQTIVPLSGRL